jgi:hypothetical protein
LFNVTILGLLLSNPQISVLELPEPLPEEAESRFIFKLILLIVIVVLMFDLKLRVI